MNTITIPEIPAGLVVLVNFFAPYLVSLIVAASWSAKTKQLVAGAASVVLTGLALGIAHYGFGVALGANLWLVVLLGLIVLFFAYNTVHRELADALTKNAGVGSGGAKTANDSTVSTASAAPEPTLFTTSSTPAPLIATAPEH